MGNDSIFYEASEIKKLCKELEEKRKTRVLTLLFGQKSITDDKVNTIYDKLKTEFKGTKKLDVIIDSSGGDIDAAYMIAKLLRRYASERLTFIVPRWAKSAATLLVCSGNEIIMGPTGELGPLDPQITIYDKDGNVQKHYSPLSLRSTFDLLKSEYNNGNGEVAKTLADKLDPIELGDSLHSLQVSERYMKELLVTRMLKGNNNAVNTASQIANEIAMNYPHHGYCIDFDECKNLKLNIVEPEESEWDIVWKIYCKYEELERKKILEAKQKQAESINRINRPINKGVR